MMKLFVLLAGIAVANAYTPDWIPSLARASQTTFMVNATPTNTVRENHPVYADGTPTKYSTFDSCTDTTTTDVGTSPTGMLMDKSGTNGFLKYPDGIDCTHTFTAGESGATQLWLEFTQLSIQDKDGNTPSAEREAAFRGGQTGGYDIYNPTDGCDSDYLLLKGGNTPFADYCGYIPTNPNPAYRPTSPYVLATTEGYPNRDIPQAGVVRRLPRRVLLNLPVTITFKTNAEGGNHCMGCKEANTATPERYHGGFTMFWETPAVAEARDAAPGFIPVQAPAPVAESSDDHDEFGWIVLFILCGVVIVLLLTLIFLQVCGKKEQESKVPTKEMTNISTGATMA